MRFENLLGFFGEPGRNRTYNQQIKSLLLCQLSYGPTRGDWHLRLLARPAGFEPATFGSGGQRSIQLSYGRTERLTVMSSVRP